MKLTRNHIFPAFVLGVAIGVMAAEFCSLGSFRRPGGRDRFHEQALQRFSRQVRLTPQQRAQVASILEAKRQKIDALRADMRPTFEEIRASASAEIRQLLTPAQQQRFDRFEADWHARWERYRARRK